MRPETPPTLPPGTEMAGYVLEERIGAGGFGEVYRARHPALERVAAIKVLHVRYSHDAEALARFADEARAVNRIKHPGIVDIYEIGRAHDREYCVMELIEGRSLRDVLAERGKLPLAEAIPLLRSIAEAVDAAHAVGIAHRDLKPDNVFVVGKTTKLIDFGLAKLVADGAVTETGSVFGTPLYMSPEQCRGRGVDTRTDIYSFGALAYQMLAGAPPFAGDPIELALHHLNDPPPPPRISRTVDRVLLALLAKDPAARPSKLVHAVAALEGSAKLRVRRSKRALLALIPIAAIAFVAWPRREPVACASKLDWPAQRAVLAKRFTGPGLARLLGKLDGFAAEWTSQWHAACRADRDADPLLYGQRLACLETLQIDFQDTVRQLQTDEQRTIDELALEGLGTAPSRSLSDCRNAAVLRAQVPPPPAAVRDRVAAKRLEVQRLLVEGWAAQMHRDRAAIDRVAARVDTLAREIEALDPPSAGTAIRARVDLLVANAADTDVTRIADLRAAREDAARRLEAARDDIDLAQAQLSIASDAVLFDNDLDRAVELADRAQQTIDRAGRPLRAQMALSYLRGDIAVRLARFDEAVASYRRAMELGRADDSWSPYSNHAYIAALARGGRLVEARQQCEGWIAEITARYGADHPILAAPHVDLSMVLQLEGDLANALVHQRIAAAHFASQQDILENRNAWGRLYIVDLELQLGKADRAHAIETIEGIANLGSTPNLANHDGPSTARRAGLYAAYLVGVENSALPDHLATIAFHRGDTKQMAAQARIATEACAQMSCATTLQFSRWLVETANFAALEAEYRHSPLAISYTGIVLASQGKWQPALAKLEAARAVPHYWEKQADLADLDAWLGLARLHAGQIDRARTALEESLMVISISFDGYDGFTYTRPMAELALADLLSDKARAHALAKSARAGFLRLGRTADAARAEAWLASH